MALAAVFLPRVSGGGGTEFGGGIGGPSSFVTNVLSSLAGHDGFRWMRSASPHVPEYGFDGLSDVRLFVPRSDRPSDVLPDDLFETYRAARHRLPDFPGAPEVWEVWNEPDFYFVRNSAADMAATLKAAWWGVKAGRPNAQVLMPSLAFRPGRYALEMAVNGLASWTDGWNAHFYGWSSDYPAFLAHQQAFATAIGCEKPLWITEIGHLGMPQTVADDPSAHAIQAAFHERTMIESWARGVDRHLLFFLAPFTEARNEMGLTVGNGAWRPALSSAVRVARTLPGSRPIYRIFHRPTGEDVGIVLERDTGSWWTILWSPVRPGDTVLPGVAPRRPAAETIRLRPSWPLGLVEMRVGIEGDVALAPSQLRELELTPGGNLHLHGPSVRFGLSECRWIPWSKGDRFKPAVRREARAELREVPPLRQPSPVVVRFRPDASMAADKPAQVLRVGLEEGGSGRLEFYNFSEQPQAGAWELEVPPGWSVESDGADPALAIPALERRDVPVRIQCLDPARSVTAGPGRFRARWRGADGSVDESSVRLDVELPPGRVWHAWDWRNIVATPGRADAWQVYVQDQGVIAIEVRSAWGLNRETALHLPLPRGVRSGDVVSVGLRLARGRGSPYVQMQMTTAAGESWRHGELVALGPVSESFQARLGDFGPAIWGRHRTLLLPPVDDARWLTLMIQGVQPGDVLELRNPALLRRSAADRGGQMTQDGG